MYELYCCFLMCRLNSYLRSLKKTEPTLPLRITTLSYDIGKATAVEFFRVTHAQPHAHTPVKSEGKGKKKRESSGITTGNKNERKRDNTQSALQSGKGAFPHFFSPLKTSLSFSPEKERKKSLNETQRRKHTLAFFAKLKSDKGTYCLARRKSTAPT